MSCLLSCFKSCNDAEIFIAGTDIGGKLKCHTQKVKDGPEINRYKIEIPKKNEDMLAGKMGLKDGDELFTLNDEFLPARNQNEVLELFGGMKIGKNNLMVSRKESKMVSRKESKVHLLRNENSVVPKRYNEQKTPYETIKFELQVCEDNQQVCLNKSEGDIELNVQHKCLYEKKGLYMYRVLDKKAVGGFFMRILPEEKKVDVAHITEEDRKICDKSKPHYIKKTYLWKLGANNTQIVYDGFYLSNASKTHYINIKEDSITSSTDGERFQISRIGDEVSIRSQKTGWYIDCDENGNLIPKKEKFKHDSEMFIFKELSFTRE